MTAYYHDETGTSPWWDTGYSPTAVYYDNIENMLPEWIDVPIFPKWYRMIYTALDTSKQWTGGFLPIFHKPIARFKMLRCNRKGIGLRIRLAR